ncbi:glycosyltransferase family 2 protein [Halobacterium hubeiense]|uniref:glycosyltransferase family 2 protein n=1 Tax=Halobacterium hubeiense TaxID=1407499 RepID=UPI003C70865D
MHEYAPIDLDPGAVSASGDVVIVNYNGRSQLSDTLPVWVKRREEGYVDEILVVDNDSSDGSVEFLSKQFPEVRVVANKENVGWSNAVNRGFEAANAEYVFVTTPDMVVTQSWCHRLLEGLDADVERGAATGIIVRPSGEVDGRGANRDALFRFSPAAPSDEIHSVDSGRGSGLLVRRTAFEEAGGIDDDLFIQWDEVSLTLNLQDAGYETVFVPGALAWHCEPLGDTGSGLEYYNARNHYLLAGRHCERRDFFTILLLNAGIHFLGHPVAAALGRRDLSAVARTWKGATVGIARALGERLG